MRSAWKYGSIIGIKTVKKRNYCSLPWACNTSLFRWDTIDVFYILGKVLVASSSETTIWNISKMKTYIRYDAWNGNGDWVNVRFWNLDLCQGYWKQRVTCCTRYNDTDDPLLLVDKQKNKKHWEKNFMSSICSNIRSSAISRGFDKPVVFPFFIFLVLEFVIKTVNDPPKIQS